MVRPRRVKARALTQRDWYRVPKKFRRAAPIPKKKPAKKGFDWWPLIWLTLAGAATALLIFHFYTAYR